MKKIKLDETTKYINGDKCKTLEYQFKIKELSLAQSTITGRYPEIGYCCNEACSELLYIVKGNGTLNKKEESISFNEGDAIYIEKGEKFYWDANCVSIAICSPAWYEEQHKELLD